MIYKPSLRAYILNIKWFFTLNILIQEGDLNVGFKVGKNRKSADGLGREETDY